MNITIHKYRLPLDFEENIQLRLPAGAKLLQVANQIDRLCLWAEVDPSAAQFDLRTFFLAGTGRPLPIGRRQHLGSVVLGALVCHLYELHPPSERL
jgi:hypothetical protein